MKSRKKVAAILAVCMLVCASLAACGGQELTKAEYVQAYQNTVEALTSSDPSFTVEIELRMNGFVSSVNSTTVMTADGDKYYFKEEGVGGNAIEKYYEVKDGNVYEYYKDSAGVWLKNGNGKIPDIIDEIDEVVTIDTEEAEAEYDELIYKDGKYHYDMDALIEEFGKYGENITGESYILFKSNRLSEAVVDISIENEGIEMTFYTSLEIRYSGRVVLPYIK